MIVIGVAKDLELTLDDNILKIEPFVTEKYPEDYMILGADSLLKNPNESKNLIKKKALKAVQNISMRV
jgi:hypothetical protein